MLFSAFQRSSIYAGPGNGGIVPVNIFLSTVVVFGLSLLGSAAVNRLLLKHSSSLGRRRAPLWSPNPAVLVASEGWVLKAVTGASWTGVFRSSASWGWAFESLLLCVSNIQCMHICLRWPFKFFNRKSVEKGLLHPAPSFSTRLSAPLLGLPQSQGSNPSVACVPYEALGPPLPACLSPPHP